MCRCLEQFSIKVVRSIHSLLIAYFLSLVFLSSTNYSSCHGCSFVDGVFIPLCKPQSRCEKIAYLKPEQWRLKTMYSSATATMRTMCQLLKQYLDSTIMVMMPDYYLPRYNEGEILIVQLGDG